MPPALHPRTILFQTLTGSVGVGTFSFTVGSLHRFTTLRLALSATSSALTATVRQQISSHALHFDVTSAVTITSGGAFEFPVYATQALVQVVASSASQLRVEAAGLSP